MAAFGKTAQILRTRSGAGFAPYTNVAFGLAPANRPKLSDVGCEPKVLDAALGSKVRCVKNVGCLRPCLQFSNRITESKYFVWGQANELQRFR